MITKKIMINKELLIYQGKNWEIILKEDSKNETIWASQKQIAEIFDVNRPAITKHLFNIFGDEELDEKVVCSILEHTTQHWAIDWKKQITKTKFYNLDAIISVWYRVNSKKATQFRIWATKTLKEHITKGFTINKNRLQQNYEKFFKLLTDKIYIQLLKKKQQNCFILW